jgi:hypothetical protein
VSRASFSAVLALAACAGAPDAIDSATKRERYRTIRDLSAQMGVYNASLVAGIAISETGLAHCWSEATWACQGPASPSCGGGAGPIIAGAHDGPCSAQEGGLGMFQFDAGTYSDTLALYGPSILTIDGNTAQAVAFVIDKVTTDIAGAPDWLAAADWMNHVALSASDETMARWAALLACRYNGCCTPSPTCTTRANGYRDNALAAFAEMGSDFWRTADHCSALPDGGVIDPRTACYIAGGDPRYWRRASAGRAGALEWTYATAAPARANFAEWIVRTGRAGRYHIEVHLDAGTHGQSKHARYEVSHAGTVDAVVIDQTSATGFVSLGDYDFAGTGDEHVLLGDNTGDAASAQVKLAFDAVRVTALDGSGSVRRHGCTSTRAAGALGGALVALALLRRRRRR